MSKYKIKVTIVTNTIVINTMWVDNVTDKNVQTTNDSEKAKIFEDNDEAYLFVINSIKNAIIKIEKVEIK